MQSAIIGSQDFVYGIAEIQNLVAPDPQTDPLTYIPSGFGTLKSASLERFATAEEIEDCKGDIRAYLMKNPGWELDCQLTCSASLTLTEMGSRLKFPIADIFGFILPGLKVMWQSKGLKMVSFKARHWDALGNSPTVTIAA